MLAAFVAGMTFDDFVQDVKTQFAVIRALEIVGEATKRLPESIRKQEPHMPWRAIAGMRDKLTHHYFGVNLEVVWKTATEDIPNLEPALRRLVATVQAANG
jgi:uncharacterized protein with HEPN domain